MWRYFLTSESGRENGSSTLIFEVPFFLDASIDNTLAFGWDLDDIEADVEGLASDVEGAVPLRKVFGSPYI